MRHYVVSHRLLDGLVASLVLSLAAVASGDRWLRFPQLVDGIGRGVPVALVVVALFGSVVLTINPYPVLAFERIRWERSLIPLDVGSVALLLMPPTSIVVLHSLVGSGGDHATVVLRDIGLVIGLTSVVAGALPSREAAALSPVVYIVGLGLLGTYPSGEARPWAILLDRSTSAEMVALSVACALIAAVLVEVRLRRRAFANWASTGG